MFYKFTPKSRNEKTGDMPVTTTSRESCPDACPFKGKGCYAESFRLRMVWDKVTRGELDATDLKGLCKAINALPNGTLWRHNQAGDLPGHNDKINSRELNAIVNANKGKRGFTYTHKPPTRDNLKKIRAANKAGFTINLSANNPKHADKLMRHNLPVVTVLPIDHSDRVSYTPKGNKIVQCPATYRDDITCKSCGLCQHQNRPIIGFPAHGMGKKHANSIAKKG